MVIISFPFRLVLRVRPRDIDEYYSTKVEGIKYKFGCSVEEGRSLLNKAKSLSMEVVGVRSVSQCMATK